MILDKIIQSTRARVAREKEVRGLEEMREQALSIEAKKEFPFEKMLWTEGIQFICEVGVSVQRSDRGGLSLSGYRPGI